MKINIEKNPKIEKLVIGNSNINDFRLLSNRRKLREGAVRKLVEKLERGEGFEAPFVLSGNAENGYNLIDGNHRLEAISRWLEVDSEGSVEIYAFIYPDLSSQEEKDMYTEWNQGSKQSTNDFIQQYEDEIPLLKMLPFCSIYGERDTIPFFRLVGAYLAAQAPKFQGGFLGTPWQFVEISRNMNEKHAEDIKEFMNIFLESFGPLDEKYTIEGKMKINPFKKTTPITAIMKIWFSNRNKIDSKQMVKVFKKLLGHSKTNELLSLSGMSACKYAHLQILNILNENANIKFKE